MKQLVVYNWNDVARTRHFLGSIPDGTTQLGYPKCDDCGNTMSLYAQIDSIKGAFDLADFMVIHNYGWFHCFTVKCQLK